jgi:hypothetical protein
MENSAVSGYITEKLVDAFIGGCLPIYTTTGTEHEKYSICSTQSPKAFIFYDIYDIYDSACVAKLHCMLPAAENATSKCFVCC